jgi:hypothetical protein
VLQVKKVISMHFGTFPALTGTPAQLAELIKDFGNTGLGIDAGEDGGVVKRTS